MTNLRMPQDQGLTDPHAIAALERIMGNNITDALYSLCRTGTALEAALDADLSALLPREQVAIVDNARVNHRNALDHAKKILGSGRNGK